MRGTKSKARIRCRRGRSQCLHKLVGTVFCQAFELGSVAFESKRNRERRSVATAPSTSLEGTSGIASARLAAVTPSARSLPVLKEINPP